MFARLRPFAVPCAIILGALVLLVLRFNGGARSVVRDFLSPFLQAEQRVEAHLDGDSLFHQPKVDLILEIQSLREEVARHSIDRERLAVLERENRQLREALNIQTNTEFRPVTARVLNRDVATGGRRIQIDHGHTAGLRVGQAVLVRSYLIGRIIETSDKAAYLVTIADASCRVSVRLAGTGYHGILSGDPGEYRKAHPVCVVQHLPRDGEYHGGDVVVTSGYGLQVPPGLEVGTIQAASLEGWPEHPIELDRTVRVEPYAFAEDFTFVTVLTEMPGT